MKTLRRIHRHSRMAFAALDLAAREALVLAAYSLARAPLTDREAAEALGCDDLNECRPAVTRLVEKKLLREIGEAKCATTGKTVRVCTPTAKARGR